MPELEVIEGGGCGSLFSISADAEAFLCSLSPADQALVSEGFSRAYSKVIRLLVNMSLVPFSSREDSIALTVLASDSIMLDVSGFAIKCAIRWDSRSIHMEILTIRPRDTLASYSLHELR
jgi:hypothetical protein